MHVPKRSNKRFCSTICQNEWQKTQVGLKNARFTSVKDSCHVCGKEIFVPPHKYKKSNHFFCSDECRRIWYKEEFSQSESWKDSSRERCLRCLSDGTFCKTTKPQILTNKFLESLNISFENEVAFQYYSVDNYLSDYNLVIEVQGDYWHSNPLHYDCNKLGKTQLNCLRRDKAKNKFFRENLKIPVLYLWESDIECNPELCKMLILEFVKRKGVLSNYNSFNYELKNNKLYLKSNIICSYSEIP